MTMDSDLDFEYGRGLLRVRDYERVLEGPVFAAMERYSQIFLDRNHQLLEPYRRRWVADPLHQWSRQWEYPFVYSALERHVHSGRAQPPVRILDAGSGVTFFPYYIASRIAGAAVTCVDYDAEWASLYSHLNATSEKHVQFTVETLQALSFPDETFDAVYCISVLEHTSDPRAVIANVRRVIRPGGIFAVTFDISLDGTADIPIHRARELIAALQEYFPASDAAEERADLSREVAAPGVLTTRYVARTNPELLPWLAAQPTGLLERLHLRRRDRYPNLTVFCDVLRR